jgi:hypothetical protein
VDVITWIQGLFDDCSFRAPFGIGWHVDRSEPPITAFVTPADCSTAQIVLARDDLLGRISFAARLQAFLDVELDRPVPPCPAHGLGLAAARANDEVYWRCAAGDFQCRIGEYQDALWPPGPTEDKAGPMLARRFHAQRLTGVHSFGVELRGGRWLTKIKIRPDADEPAIRAAAHPVRVEFEHVDPVRTVRLHRTATENEPAHEALTRTGVMILLAALNGRLHRAGASASCDFLVDNIPVRLLPAHQLGPPGSPVVLDTAGAAFADEGDSVCCVGGFAPAGPVANDTPSFHAGELRVYK